MNKGEDIQFRVPASMKAAIKRIAESRMTSESEIAREAVLLYLGSKGISASELREDEQPPPKAPALKQNPRGSGLKYRLTRK